MTCFEMIKPGQTIGIIGGGQLGRMLTFSAKEMGYFVGVLDPQADCPGGQVADWQILADYDDPQGLAEMARRCDVLTYEFENVDSQGLAQVAQEVLMPQGIQLLEITQNRQKEKAFLTENKLPVVDYRLVSSVPECQTALTEIGYPAVLKTLEGGYDGHGQLVIRVGFPEREIAELVAVGPCLLESWFPFEKEVSIMVARNHRGEIALLPVAENQHVQNILHQSLVPASISSEITTEIQELAKVLAEKIQLEGILGIEFFLGKDGRLVINEMAPRPHNSGHFSIEACDFSQFDLHILAICNRPLPEVNLLSSAVMVNILGQHVTALEEALINQPTWHVHMYGKRENKDQRKVGHVTILTTNLAEKQTEIAKSAIWK